MTVRQIFYVKIMGIRSPKSIKKRGGCEIFRRKGDWQKEGNKVERGISGVSTILNTKITLNEQIVYGKAIFCHKVALDV